MSRKTSYTLLTAVGIVILIVIGYVFRDLIGFALMRYYLEPGQSFAATPAPEAPDYAQSNAWAALPEREDNADLTPQGVEDAQSGAPVDVFFIHPTTYYTSDGWNQPLNHAQANEFTDEQVLPNQAATFNSCCQVYAPRYRQATLFSFLDRGGDGGKALDLAYADVRAAFEHFLEHRSQGRPFIIAGHSQGGLHADWLMRDYVAGGPLEERMVAAYPIGFSIDGSNGVPVCEHAEQTGCQVSWNTMAQGAERRGPDSSNDICVNPITWRTDGARADFADNLGGVSFADGAAVEAGVTDGQCVDGILEITEVRSDNYGTQMFGEGNYHVYDYSLFHMNIRQNAQARVNAYLSATAQP